MTKRFLGIALCAFLGASLFALDVQKDIIDRSRTYVGCAYSTGGTRPPEFDCSGFVGYILRPFVPGLPRLSRDMADSGTPIAKDALEPGDLVFFATTQVPGAISHVALYIGGGSIIHAISDGPERGIHVTPLGARYWQTHFASAVRVLPPSASASGETASAAPAKTASAQSAAPAPKSAATTPKPAATTAKSSATAPKSGAAAPKPATADTSPSPAKPAVPAPKGAPETAASAPSPWDTWNGYIRGDYEQWKAQEQRKLEAQEKAYDKNKEKSDFDEWKKANGE
ncbi:MAG TPA: NlpC/P60 family protein [Treponemataceae bacterium]|nr:NlpC/P60 family protein [Treponemataceae bacterium]